MTKLKINNTTTWQQLEQNIHDTSTLEFESHSRTLFEQATAYLGYPTTTSKVSELVKQKISETLQITNSLQITTIFNQLLRDIQVKQSDLLHSPTVQQLLQAVSQNKIIEARGSLPSFLNPQPPESLSAPLSLPSIASVDLQHQKSIHLQIQKLIIALFDQYLTTNLDKNSETLAEIYLNHLLSYLSFGDLESGTKASIPQKIDGKWELIEYTVNTLYLTPELIGGQVPAIGLLPKNRSKAQPLLLFRGTPHPLTRGALLATISDFIPGYAVGEMMYEHYSKDIIKNWITATYKTYGRINLYGLSLGGTLSLLTLSEQPDKIDSVFVFNPPAPFSKTLNLYEQNCSHLSVKPNVDIYWQEGDLIPKTGSGFHKEWKLHKIVSPIKQNLLLSHTDIKAIHEDVIVLKMDPTTENLRTSRTIITIFHNTISAFLLPVSATLVSIAMLATEGKKVYNQYHEYLYT